MCCSYRTRASGLSDDELKFDLQLIMDQLKKIIDFTIVHPTSPSYIKQAQTQLRTAQQACDC